MPLVHRSKALFCLHLLLRGALAGCLFLSISSDVRAAEAVKKVTSLAQFYELKSAEAAQGLPVQIRGTVICTDRVWGQFYFNDGVTTRYFLPGDFPTNLHHGDHIEITGKTCLINGGNGITNISSTKLPPKVIPPARPMKLNESRKNEAQWVEVTGWVRVAETSRGRLGMMLHDGVNRGVAFVMGNSAEQDPRKLLGCKIKIRAINSGTIYNDTLRYPWFMVPSMSEVTILEQPETTGLAPVKQTSIEALLERELGSWTNEPVAISGVVAAHDSGKSMLIRGVTSSITAKTLQNTLSLLNQRVNVLGYLEVSTNGAVLEDAYYEPVASAAPVAAKPVNDSIIGPVLDVPPLTNISSIMALPTAELLRLFPVRIRGTITFSDPYFQNVFLQDATDAIYVETSQTNLTSGDYAEVTGYAHPGGFMPQVSGAKAVVLGRRNLPAPIKADMDDVAGASLDCHWVEMEGIVRRASIDDTMHLLLTVTTRKGRFGVQVPGVTDPSIAAKFIDAEVRVTGAVSSVINAQGELSGITVNAPALTNVNRLDRGLKNPFDLPATAIASVARFDPRKLVGHRLKIVGTVTFATSEGTMYVQEGRDGLRVSLQDTNQFRAGDYVEVLGFPAIGEAAPYLEEAVARKIDGVGNVEVATTTAEKILQEGQMNSRAVILQGVLVQPVPKAARPRLVFQDGPTIYTAYLSSYVDPNRVVGLESGTVLRIKGVCSVQAANGGKPEAFRLLVADARDIIILERPSWFTSGRLLTIVSVLVVAVLGSLTWIRLLRRQVRAQTEVIRQKLEERREFAEKLAAEKQLLATLINHMPDHVFARDAEGKYLLANSSYVEFHGTLPMEQMPGKTLFDCFPEEVARVRAVRDKQIVRGEIPMAQEEEEVPDKNGNRHWVHTIRVPLRDERRRITGLVGISRNITERKRAQAEMERMHNQLVETSRLAGMAEVATSVLHNVGNVLNSVNVSASVIQDQIKASRVKKVADVSGLLKANAGDLGRYLTTDPKGKQLPGYIDALGSHLEQERSAMLTELESLTHNIEHIKEIVSMQQNYAKVRGVVETVPVADLIEDALRINAGAIERHALELRREYDTHHLPTVTVEKHKVLQILINLIRNAKYACDESGRQDKVLTVRATNGDGRVKIHIQDNGVGIPPENLTRIFNHGFTTRKTGHGFGLHSGALAAKELSGSLTAHSDGPGKGATFTLDLPADPYRV